MRVSYSFLYFPYREWLVPPSPARKRKDYRHPSSPPPHLPAPGGHAQKPAQHNPHVRTELQRTTMPNKRSTQEQIFLWFTARRQNQGLSRAPASRSRYYSLYTLVTRARLCVIPGSRYYKGRIIKVALCKLSKVFP